MSQDTLIQLPNKDLWRGANPDRAPKSNVDTSPQVAPSVGETMAANKDAKECLWCGMKFDSNDLLKSHVESLHIVATNMKAMAKEFLTGAGSGLSNIPAPEVK